MPMISAGDRDYIRDHFAEKLKGDVRLELFTQKRSPLVVPGRDECQYCEETQQLLSEVADLSDHVTLIVHDVKENPRVLAENGVDHIPTLVYHGQNKGTLRFLGIPAGNEFRNVIDTIVEVGNGESDLAETTREALAGLAQDLHLRVFVTPT
jgi:alkyl hydroperoxide reductase subunit AhpF